MTQATVGYLDANGYWVPVTAANGLPTSGGGGATVTSVNGDTGDVVLTAADVNALPTSYAPTWSEVTSKPTTFPPAAHSATLITSGTLADARIPALAIAKITGLQAIINDLTARIEALETTP